MTIYVFGYEIIVDIDDDIVDENSWLYGVLLSAVISPSIDSSSVQAGIVRKSGADQVECNEAYLNGWPLSTCFLNPLMSLRWLYGVGYKRVYYIDDCVSRMMMIIMIMYDV